MENPPAFDPVISVCENIRLPKNIQQVSLSSVLERIKDPEQRIINLQKKFRETKDDKYKRGLPGFTTSGTFSERKASGLTSTSGLMMLDFDKLPDPETLQRERNKLIDCPFVMVVFMSPSGKGLKAIIRIRDWQNHSDYKSIFIEAGAYFDSEYFDSGTSDIARLAFFAHDQDIYINWDAEIFDPEHYLDRDMDTFRNEMSNRIKNEKKSFTVGNRNNFVFDLACDYRREGFEKQQALDLILEQITLSPDFDRKEVKRTLDSAYKSDKFSSAREDFEFWDVENEGEPSESLQKTKKNPFPIEVFPEKVQEIIINLQDTFGFPIDYTATAMMYSVSVSMGLSYKLMFKKGWYSIGAFYFALVGKPGNIKTPPLTFILKAIEKKDAEFFKKFVQEKSDYEYIKNLTKKERQEEGLELPEKEPILKQFLVSDFTPEALIDVLSKNENGIGLYVDELTSWTNNFDRYNKGSEQQFWLSVWSGTPIRVNRKNGNNYYISDPFISIIGTIQDNVLVDLANGKIGNGFLDRILFAYPDDQDKKPWNENESDEEISDEWEKIINRVLELESNPENIIKLAPDAKSYLLNWNKELTDYLNRPENYNLRSIYAKLETYVLRFSLLMEVFYCACGESKLMDVSLRSTKASTKLIEYFLRTALKVHAVISKSNNDPVEKLSLIEQRVFNALPKEFKFGEGYKMAEENGMSRKIFRGFIQEDQGNGKKNIFFETVKHGVYRKKYNSHAHSTP